MYKISIIIPVYNAEKYLNEAINSVLNQSIGFENIQLIIVDDNSNDNSKKIIKHYDESFDNILGIYLDKNHGLPGFGRNVGIDNADGEYLMFLDNDDKLDEDICKKLYESSVESKVDLIGCNLYMFDEENSSPITYHIHKKLGNNNKILLKNDDIFLLDCGKTHGKLFKKEIITKYNIKFNETLSFEDFLFLRTFELYANDLIYLTDYHGYYWRVRADSTSHSISPKYVKNAVKSNYILLKLLKEHCKDEYFDIIFLNLSYVFFHCFDLNCANSELKEILVDLYNFEKEINFCLKFNEFYINFINYFVIHQHYGVAIRLINFFQKLKKIVKN